MKLPIIIQDVNMAFTCSIDIISKKYNQSLSSESKVKDTLLSLLKDGANIEDIIQVVTAPRSTIELRKIMKTNPSKVQLIKKFQDEKFVRDLLGSDKNINLPEAVTTQTKELAIDNPDAIVQNGKRAKIWLSEAWGVASLAQNKFVQDTNREIQSRILGMIKNANTNESAEIVLNRTIQEYFNYNLNQLAEFFDRQGKSDYAQIIRDNMPFDKTNPNERINYIVKSISDYFQDYSDSEKMAYADPKNTLYDKSRAFARFLLIQPLNFDNFLASNVNSIQIRNKGKLTSDINKYGIQLGKGRQNMTWQDEDAVYSIAKMVDDFVQREIGNWPLYRKQEDVWTKQSDEYCETNKVVSVLTKVMRIADVKNKDFKPIIVNKANDALIEDLKNTFKVAFGINIKTNKEVIDEVFEKYIENRTLPQIVRNINQAPQYILPIVMYLLTEQVTFKKSKAETSFKEGIVKLNDNEVNIVYSIWKNMFDPLNNNSLYNQVSQNKEFDLYQMISQVLLTHDKKELYGIVNDMGTIEKKNYSLGRANQRLNQLQSKINGAYSPLLNKGIFNVTIENDFEGDEPNTTITYKVPMKNDKYIIKIVKGKKATITKDGVVVTGNPKVLQDLKGLFTNVIKIKFDQGNFLDIYLNKIGNGQQKALDNLIDITANLIYANEVSKYLNGESTSDFKDKLKRFYDPTVKRPNLVKGVTYNQIDAFSGRMFPLITQLSLANDINEGIIGDIVVKGGSGEQINSVILRTLTTQFSQFMEEKSQDPESAIKHFSIKDAIKRMTFLRDYVDKTGDVKSSTSMNVEEFFLNSFIYDFYGDSLAVHLGVLSDKPNIPKMELYVDTPILVETTKEGKQIIKKLKECTAEDLKKIAIRELGEYYKKMKNEIDRNLTILTNYSPRKIVYDINTDYIETRGISKKELENDIHNAIYLAQQAGEDIEINELLYFSWDKDGNLHTKPSLIAELAKHDVEVNKLGLKTENSSEFFQRKEHELVTNLLQDLKHGISFIDSQSQKIIDSSAVKAMRKANENGWSNKKNIIIAKIINGEDSRNLIDKRSLTDWKPYKDFFKYVQEFGGFNLSKLDINGNFDFEYFLYTLNENYDKIQEYSHLQSLKRKIKKQIKKKLLGTSEGLDKKALTEQYRQWRKENRPEETEVELEQAVLNYETESDERIWRSRNASYKTEGIDNITSVDEIEKLKEEYELNDFDTSFEKKSGKFSLQINPEISRYNTLHYLYSEEGLNSTVGSHINHKVPYTKDLTLMGALETGQQAKRNVSESGAKNQYTRGDINGVGKYITIAVMRDVKAGISTINGIQNSRGATVMDGSTIGNYVTRKEELYSLGSQKAGIENSKPLGDDLNPKTGTGTIIKTAVFVLTNSRIRTSEANIVLHKHMNSIPWKNFDGNFLIDYDGNNINYKPVIVFKPSEGKYYLRTDFQIEKELKLDDQGNEIEENGVTSFKELELGNQEQANNLLKVDVGGITIGDLIKTKKDLTPYLNTIAAITKPKVLGDVAEVFNIIRTTRPIFNNYELWDLFGGAYSASINDFNELSYKDDNTSLDNLTIAAHSCGTKINKNVTRPTNEDVYLPLKEAKIDWIVTEGAIKQGASNVNSTDMLNNINYKVTTQRIATADIGMQLNPEHLADNSHITLMTQVVNALGLRGFSSDAADKVYKALATLTDTSLEELFKGIELKRITGDDSQFKEAVSSLLLKSIIGTSETDGDLLSSIVVQLNKQDRTGHDYDIIRHRLPISDPAILNKLISNFSSLMTKAGVRIQFPGSMNVLVPSDGIYKIHAGKLRSIAHTQRYSENDLIPNNEEVSELQELQELQKEQKPLAGLHEITIGASYFIRITNKHFNSDNPLLSTVLAGKSIKVDDLSTYYQLRDLLKGTTYTITEDVITGRDLAPYNCSFNTDKGMYMLWDLDSIKHIHMIENNPEKVLNIYSTYTNEEIAREFHINPENLDKTDIKSFTESFKKLINRRKQIELNSIGSGNNNSVFIDGQKVFIDKSTLKVSPYELIAPKNYKTTFGLQVGDNVQEITENKLFFLKRMIDNQYRLENGHWVDRNPVSSDKYDIILKAVSGKSYPILYKSDNTKIPEGLSSITEQEFYANLDWDGSKVYRLNGNGERIYELPYHKDSNGKIVYDAEILIDENGNEVIYTNKLDFFTNKLQFNYVDFGKNILNLTFIYDVFKQLSTSKKNSVKQLFLGYLQEIEQFNGISRLEDRINKEKDEQKKEDLNNQLVQIITNGEINSQLKQQISEGFNIRDQYLTQLNAEILAGEIKSNYTGMFAQIINSAIETHTSFLKSLDYIVSRTPAQSHQSFMPMKLVAFDESDVNSAYVSRYQLYLQGSDFDVDKASLLGSIIRNGRYVTWSPFMSLQSIEHLRASETLPFPTGKRLEVKENLNNRVYDKMDKPIHLVWHDDTRIIFTLPNFNQEIYLAKNQFGIWVSNLTQDMMRNQMTPIEVYLIERAITDKIPEGEIFNAQFNISHLGFNENRVKDSSKYLYEKDFEQFINCFAQIFDYNEKGQYEFNKLTGRTRNLIDVINNGTQVQLDPINYDNLSQEQLKQIQIDNIKQLSILINALNSFGQIPKVMSNDLIEAVQRTVNQHNTYFTEGSSDAKDAVVNYISSNMFQISSDPVNLVQAMTSVDQQTDYIKEEIANKSPLAEQSKHFDKGNIMSIFRLLRLTLSGKQNTGIEASSLKVMEAINQYQDVILNYGTDEEQKSLIKPINIGGYNIRLICNAYCKNIANIKSKEVYDALQEIDNDNDQAIWLSAFLSLSTDNAKDPTLAKINANPEMIGLYNAGFVLGLPIRFLSKIIMSPTGMAIADVQQGDIFLGYKSSRDIGRVIDYIKRGPKLGPNITTLEILGKAIQLHNPGEVSIFNLNKQLIRDYWDQSQLLTARRIIALAKSLAYGKEGDQIEYNIPTVESRLSKDIQLTRRRISGITKALEAKQQQIAEKDALGKKHKRLDEDVVELTTTLESLNTKLIELQDIRNEYKITQTIPQSRVEGDQYDLYKKYLENYNSIKDGEQSNSLKKLFEDNKEYIQNSANFKKTIQDIENWLDTLEQIQLDEGYTDSEGNKHSTINILSTLNEFASEMSLIRPNLGLNQQLPNSKENQLSFIKKFENIINDRITTGKVENASRIEEIQDFKDLNESKGIEGLNVSVSEFIWDENYRNTAIKAYDSIKFKVNALDVLVKVPHYFGYLKACDALYQSLSYQSVQYREQDRILSKIIVGDLKIKSSKDIQSRLKTASRYISRQMNNMFLLEQNIELNIPKITEGKVDNSIKVPIKLGTKEGNEAFKEWMDFVVIPQYKSKYKSNKFLDELSEAAYHKSDNHNTIINYTTGIDSMTSNPTEVMKFAEVTEGFNNLQSKTVGNLPLIDAFFYYDLIAYDRQPGQLSLTPIFNKLVAIGKTKVISDYVQFVSDLDQGGNIILTLDDSQIDEIKRFIAPIISIYALDDFDEEYGWVKDPADQQFYLIKRNPKPVKTEDNEGGAMEDPYEDNPEIDDQGIGPDGDVNYDDNPENPQYQQITLSSKLAELEWEPGVRKFERVTDSGNLNSPYIENFIIQEQKTVLEGQGIITSNEIRFGNDLITLDDNGKPNIPDNIRKRLKEITGQNNIDNLIVTKVIVEGSSRETVIDIDTTKGNLENPCKG